MDRNYYIPVAIEPVEFKNLMLRHGITKTDLVKSGWFEEYEIANCLERSTPRKATKALQKLFGIFAHERGWL
jgi:NOL1/NOP2/fmu family ribosome biogenesis protein